MQEFSPKDNVELYIITRHPNASAARDEVQVEMRAWARDHMNATDKDQLARLPALYLITEHLSTDDLAGLYKASDGFVLPTRGEGWGMPVAEAMAMGKPVVVTNWSGVTAFVDESVGYMVDYTLQDVGSLR
jgi:glycosyltransferase involved in cell wall biosynthesis